jgi:hypothetical protein
MSVFSTFPPRQVAFFDTNGGNPALMSHYSRSIGHAVSVTDPKADLLLLIEEGKLESTRYTVGQLT